MKKVKRRIAVIDFETDPFKYGRIPKPFAWGFYDGEKYVDHWESDTADNGRCVNALVDFIIDYGNDVGDMLIYAHNGGKFDFLFMLPYLSGDIKIVNGRILQANLEKHLLRDSYAIMPIKLAKLGDKLDIEYEKMEADVREDNKDEILVYLKADCVELHKAVMAFVDEFGDSLTIGGTAMRALKTFHKFETANQSFDSIFRNYYYGGRCQCFETGIIETNIKGYDINSSYPDVMKNCKHPVSSDFEFTSSVTPETSFVCWEGENNNAVPVREKNGLNFNAPDGRFWSTIHEFNVALEFDLIRPRKIVHAVEFGKVMPFEQFIDHFFAARRIAKIDGNKFLDLFYKLILNSAYGKFAQNCENFKDSIILPYGEVPGDPYELEFTHGEYAIWSKPSGTKTYYNVATAASITGGARASLLRGISMADRPLYCDTDSVYCEGMRDGLKIDSALLGAWDLEFEGDRIAIAGKKLYAVEKDGVCIKTASKGVKLSGAQIFEIAQGATIEYASPVPAFKLDGNHQFINRRIRRTANL